MVPVRILLKGTRMLRVSGLAVAALAVTLGLTACTSSAPAPAPTAKATSTPLPRTGDGVLTIGTLFPSSGELAFLGPAENAGVDAAVNEINAAGGYDGKPVVVIHKDSGDAGTAAPAAALTALIAAKADVVIGPTSSSIATSLLSQAAAAHVALISPAATFPVATTPATAPYFFRTIPSYATQAYALAQAIPAKSRSRVALIYADDTVGTSLAQALPAALRGQHGAVVSSVSVASTATSYSDIVANVVSSKPDAVVLATEGGATTQTRALITALTAAKLGGSALWLTSQNLADYSQALPAGTLTGVNGVLEGATPSAPFLAQLAKVNGALASTLYAAESYDATILAALAAASAKDDGGASIAHTLVATSEGGITCASWVECTTVLKTDSNIDYGGVSGPVDFARDGDLTSAYYGVYAYSAKNTYARVSTVLVG
jgi:ABC-type branched-subunit amino acid transport system substrate-binding protein